MKRSRYIYVEPTNIGVDLKTEEVIGYNNESNLPTRKELHNEIEFLKSVFHIKLIAAIAVGTVGALSIYQTLDKDEREEIEDNLSVINGSPVSIQLPVKKRIYKHDDDGEDDKDDGEDDKDDGNNNEEDGGGNNEEQEEDDGEVDHSGSEYD